MHKIVTGVVVAHSGGVGALLSEHERVTQLEVARRLSRLKSYDFGGNYDPAHSYSGHVYFACNGTLLAEQAAELGIHGPDDLFGGVVPHAFVATKVISHPLVAPDAARVRGWNPEFAPRLGDAVLHGSAVFNRDDARRAGVALLARGSVRLKPARANGGRGQFVVRDRAELRLRLDAMDEAEIVCHGLVLEQQLEQTCTLSVGQVMVGDLTASYFGLQRLSRNNAGQQVYGGSELTAVRGGYAALLPLATSPQARLAIEQARRYEAAVEACYPGFFASRRNYDVVVGVDAAGTLRSGVLEQSWRMGGATGAEIAALEFFTRHPSCDRVRAACVESFGHTPPPPADATIYFRGTDPEVGPLTKYTQVQPYGDPP